VSTITWAGAARAITSPFRLTSAQPQGAIFGRIFGSLLVPMPVSPCISCS
jgi:hypothetical protein